MQDYMDILAYKFNGLANGFSAKTERRPKFDAIQFYLYHKQRLDNLQDEENMTVYKPHIAYLKKEDFKKHHI